MIGNIKQAVAYTGYLLAARPDRVAVLGLYISRQCFVLILVDPAGVYRTDKIRWKKPPENNPLPRVLAYIDNPPPLMVDPTIQREKDGTFQIKLGKETHGGCTQTWSPALGRWTMIFKTRKPDHVIKTQYLRYDAGMTEANITEADITEAKLLTKIHSPKWMPGVVRMRRHGWVKRDDKDYVECPSENGRRRKVYLELEDEGDPFMGIETPKEALIAIWDLLEGGTFLHL